MAVRPAGAGSAGSAAARAAAGSAAVPSASAAGSAAAGSAAAAPGSPASDHILPMFSPVGPKIGPLRSTLETHPTLRWVFPPTLNHKNLHKNKILDLQAWPPTQGRQHPLVLFCQTRNFSLPVIRNYLPAKPQSFGNLRRQPRHYIRSQVWYPE